ncbi:DUF7344 domain-containing protein [Haloarcula salina]|uniref:DUF7344 domain-containing protein n=1 Tax=Haloarcula salina TaxID=1429914 RepID=A0AA41G4M3_9EURY|nr:hypothetical protein [Haloarcula salina]MBV0903544.1 hypothetical protein [Haloarcula salina]
MTDSTQSLATETVLELLRKPSRRVVVDRLADASERATLDTLAEALRKPAHAETPSHERTDAPSVHLHHVDLPMLARADVIEYDPDAGTVGRGTNFEEVADLLELIENHRGDGSVAFS